MKRKKRWLPITFGGGCGPPPVTFGGDARAGEATLFLFSFSFFFKKKDMMNDKYCHLIGADVTPNRIY
jgi:hypothetical protein